MKFGRTGHWTKMRRDIARSTVTWRRSAVSLAAWSVARGASDRGVGALAQGGYGVKQLTAMPDRSDTKVLQVLRRQTRQDCLVDIILAECRLGAEPKPPASSLSNRLIGRLDRVGLHGFSRRSASLAFSGCRLAIARGDQFLLELRLFVGRHRRLFSLRRILYWQIFLLRRRRLGPRIHQ